MGFISLKYDFSFKNLMGNEEVRKYFVSDVLGIPPEEIRSVRLKNPYLWKRYIWQKQGIVDMLLELNNDSKVNIELQIKKVKYWDKRVLFYLAKMFAADLQFGEDYRRLRKCINISILDFNLDERPEYHKVYHLLDKDGYMFSDMIEIHIIELKKQLEGKSRVDDWIRLFNAKTKEDLDMIKTENPGILAAIRELKIMNLGRGLRALYDMRLKEIRDRRAREEYVYDEGFQHGELQGKAQGEAIGEARGEAIGEAKGRSLERIGKIRKKMDKNTPIKAIADMLEEDEAFVEEVYGFLKAHPTWEDEEILSCILKKQEGAAAK